MDTKDRDELIKFRTQGKGKVDRKELVDLSVKTRNQESEFAAEVAEITFESRCLEQFKEMCKELKAAGYTRISISPVGGVRHHFTRTELRASPKSEYQRLFAISRAYFPEATGCGGDAESDIQELDITFPKRLWGVWDL